MLVWSTGTFKSRTAIEWAKAWGGNTLVVCPKGIKINWIRELKKWHADPLRFTIVSKEEFKLRTQRQYDNVIIDEADWFFSAGFKSALSKSLRAYIKRFDPNLLMATATPLRGSPWNIYTASVLLGFTWNYARFRDEFFFPMYMGPRLIWQPKKDEATKEKMRARIAKIADVVRREDHFEIPEQTYETIYIDEDAIQKKMKSENKDVAAIARFTAEHRAESMNRNKLSVIGTMAEENERLMVVCRYHEQMDSLREYLADKKIHVCEVSGRVSVKDRQAAIDRVNGAGGVLLVQSSTVEGYELPNVRVVVFASLDYSYRNRIQAEGRVLRMNAINKNLYVTLIAGDADEAVFNSLSNKQDFDPLKYKKRT